MTDDTIEDDITTYFDVIFGEYVGYVAVGYLAGGHPDNPRAIDGAVYFEWPADRDKAIDFCYRNSFRDVYCSPMLYSEKRRSMATAETTPVLWMDADDVPPSAFEIEPTISLETSPGSWHCFWVVTEPMEPAWASGMSKTMAYRHRDEGAGYEGWQLSKLLRVPGCMNLKPGLDAPWRVRLVVHGTVHAKEEFVTIFGEPGKNQRYIPMAHEIVMPDVFPQQADVLSRMPADADIRRMLHNAPHGEWSDTLFALECKLFRAGLSPADVFVLVKGCACDKYSRDGRPSTDLWADVIKASQEFMNHDISNTPGIIIQGMSENEGNWATYSPPPVARPTLLSDVERKVIADRPTFINRYVDWAKTRTKADPAYHEFAAMCLLSTIFADFGHVPAQFGKMKINMWFMILGVTTRTYKSTSKNLMEEILDPLNDPEIGYLYKLGGDASPEKLITKLSELPHRSTLFLRDEISGLFGDMKGGKSYMTGLAETMTELYDGKVRARLRMTGSGKDTQETGTAFNVFVCGVPGKVSEIMNPEDFASGFMARFLYVIGEPEPMTKETHYLPQAPENQGDSDSDPVAKKLRTELYEAREYWAKNAAPGDTKPIRFDADAWDRWNEAAWELGQMANKEENAGVLEPTTNRLNKQILKLAALLAMAECKSRVTLTHVLMAIEQAEKWYQTMVQMSQMIQTSEWSMKVHNLVDYIKKKGGQVAWSVAFRSLMIPSKEFGDLIFGAIDAKLIKVVTDEKNTRYLVVDR